MAQSYGKDYYASPNPDQNCYNIWDLAVYYLEGFKNSMVD